MSFFHWLFNPRVDGSSAIILIRIFAGLTFIGEGFLKFFFSSLGAMRFKLIGIPFPEFHAYAIGTLEIIGGICLLLGLFNNLFCLLFAIEMIFAFATTKIGLFLGTSPLPLPPVPPQIGFWALVHESRDDYAQFFAMVFLLILGPGKFSLDAYFSRRKHVV